MYLLQYLQYSTVPLTVSIVQYLLQYLHYSTVPHIYTSYEHKIKHAEVFTSRPNFHCQKFTAVSGSNRALILR